MGVSRRGASPGQGMMAIGAPRSVRRWHAEFFLTSASVQASLPSFLPLPHPPGSGGPVSLSGPPFPHVFIARPRTSVLQLLRECVADVAEGPSPPKTFLFTLPLKHMALRTSVRPRGRRGIVAQDSPARGGYSRPLFPGFEQPAAGETEQDSPGPDGVCTRETLLESSSFHKSCLHVLRLSVRELQCSASPLPSGFDEINYESLTLLCAGQVQTESRRPSGPGPHVHDVYTSQKEARFHPNGLLAGSL